MKRKFWNWVKNEGELSEERTLFLNGEISDETGYGDEVTPKLFKDELNEGSGDITVWINSPGGDVFAAAQIYNMLRDYKGHVTVKIDGLAASAASVIAVAGDTVLVSPVAMMMIHNPATLVMGNTKDMEAAIAMLNEVKESILNAYVDKTGLSRNKLSQMMDDTTWLSPGKAIELGFADKILFDKEDNKQLKKSDKEIRPDESDEPDEGDKGEGTEEEKKKKKKPQFEQNSYAYSVRSVTDSFLNKLQVQNASEKRIPVDQLRKRLDLIK